MVDYIKKTQKLIKNYFKKKYSKSSSSLKNKKKNKNIKYSKKSKLYGKRNRSVRKNAINVLR
mgnify:CR=1 FL=1